jgi:hypothetical protein
LATSARGRRATMGGRTGARRAGACRACRARARRLQGGAGAEAGEAREGPGAGRAAAAGAGAAGALAAVVRVRLRNAHLRPKGAWGDDGGGTSWMARCAVPGQGCPSRHQALVESMGGGSGPSKIEKNACQLFADASPVSPRLQQLARAQHMFAVLATTVLLALSGPLVGRAPHLRAPRPSLLEPRDRYAGRSGAGI